MDHSFTFTLSTVGGVCLSPNYTILESIEQLGGVLVRSVDMSTGEILSPELVQNTTVKLGNSHNIQAGLVDGSLLSTAHKRIKPFVEWHTGASILKVSKAEPTKHMGGGLRGVVKGFSYGARRRLMSKIACVQRKAKLPVFVTLTYPSSFPEPKQSKYHLKLFIQSMKRAFAEVGIIWKLEPQKRGAPHFHLLVWGVSEKKLREFVPGTWFDIAGGGDRKHLAWHEGKAKDKHGKTNKHCVSQVFSFKGVWAYASKYLGKTFEIAGWDSKEVGRYWAVVQPKNIPFGELQTLELSRELAVQLMRYQKRFAKLKKKRSYPSLSIFCDSEQWIDKLIKTEVQK